MQATELERLTRIEEQVTGVREDVGEMKGDLKTATALMSKLHESFVPRPEIEKMAQLRDQEQEKQDKEIKALWRQVDRLKLWRAWITGGLGVLTFLVGVFIELLRAGVIK